MVNKLEIQQLIDQNKFKEALVAIDILEDKDDLVLEDHLIIRLLKSQVLSKTGKTQKGLELANETLIMVRDQVSGNQLLLVDAIITKTEALRWAGQFNPGYAIEKLSGYLQLLEQGEQILETTSNVELPEIATRAAVLQRNKGIIYQSLREFDRADECFQESMTLHNKMGNKKGVVEVLVSLATTHEIKAKFDLQLKIYHDCLKLFEELGDREGKAEILLYIARVYERKGEPKVGLTYLQKSLQLADELPETFQVARLLSKIGLFYQSARDDVTAALDAYQKSMAISEKLGDKERITLCFHWLGDLYQYSKVDLNKALEYYERSMALFEEVGGKEVYGWNFGDAGHVYHLKGDLDLALIHLQKALSLFEEVGHDFLFCQALLHIGRVYRSKGDRDTALDYYKRTLKLLEEKKLLFGQDTEGLTYYELIALMLDSKDINEAKKYFEQFSQYREAKEQDKGFLSYWYKLSEALILKTSVRIKDKAQAQQLFQEIIEDPKFEREFEIYLTDSKKTALLNICELLFFELKSSPDEITEESEVFQEAKHLVDNLASLAQRQHSFSLLVNTQILQAKLFLIEGNITTAMQLMDQAITYSEKSGLTSLLNQAQQEKQTMVKDFNELRKMIENNASITERIEKMELLEYIQEVKKIKNDIVNK
jgi:tetratricopeptide (TPR) repeat protein